MGQAQPSVEGPQGQQGLQGPQGPQGPPGLKGIDGTVGWTDFTDPQKQQLIEQLKKYQEFKGPKGDQGPPGKDGTMTWANLAEEQKKNLADILVSNYKTELKGEKGETGLQGIQGLTGAIGPDGKQGVPGNIGDEVALKEAIFNKKRSLWCADGEYCQIPKDKKGIVSSELQVNTLKGEGEMFIRIGDEAKFHILKDVVNVAPRLQVNGPLNVAGRISSNTGIDGTLWCADGDYCQIPKGKKGIVSPELQVNFLRGEGEMFLRIGDEAKLHLTKDVVNVAPRLQVNGPLAASTIENKDAIFFKINNKDTAVVNQSGLVVAGTVKSDGVMKASGLTIGDWNIYQDASGHLRIDKGPNSRAVIRADYSTGAILGTDRSYRIASGRYGVLRNTPNGFIAQDLSGNGIEESFKLRDDALKQF